MLYQAVQSLDEDVLRNIKRATIKLEAYEQLQVHMRGRGLRSNSDLILGLPGETLEDAPGGACTSCSTANIDQMHNFQAMMLKGAEMETLESREHVQVRSRGSACCRRTSASTRARRCFDVEEIVVATDTLPFEDYVTARKYHLISSVFWNDSWFEPAVALRRALRRRGLAVVGAHAAGDGGRRGRRCASSSTASSRKP